MKNNEKEQLLKEKHEAIQLLIKLRTAFNAEEIDESVDALDAALATIEILEHCMDSNDYDGLPQRHDIGIACFWLCEISAHTLSHEERVKNYNMVIEILQPSLGLSWIEMYSKVIALRNSVNCIVEQKNKISAAPSATVDDLF